MKAPTKALTAEEIGRRLKAKVIGNTQKVLYGLATLRSAQASELSFLANKHYRSLLKTTAAGAVLISQDSLENDLYPDINHTTLIVTSDPYHAYAQASHWFLQDTLQGKKGIHPSSEIHETAHVDSSAYIGPYCHIGPRTQIGPEVILRSHISVGADCQIRKGTHLHPRVSVYDKVRIGKYCLIHSGAVLGADGFGFAPDEGRWHKIAQLGGLTIGDGVEIGANTCIDRGALDNTVIEEGVIIDNLVQIAHNCHIGAYSAIAGCVGIAGSTHIGERCTIAGQAGLAGHISIAEGTHIGMQAQVTKSIKQAGTYASGTGLWPQSKWRKLVARLRRLQK